MRLCNDFHFNFNDSRGDAAFNEEDNLIAVDNTLDGFDLHTLNNGAYIRTLPTSAVVPPRFPRRVTFGEMGSVVVGGGNDGKITVFDKRTGATLDTLQHGPECRGSQTVTVSEYDRIILMLHYSRHLPIVAPTSLRAPQRMIKTNLVSISGNILLLRLTTSILWGNSSLSATVNLGSFGWNCSLRVLCSAQLLFSFLRAWKDTFLLQWANQRYLLLVY